MAGGRFRALSHPVQMLSTMPVPLDGADVGLSQAHPNYILRAPLPCSGVPAKISYRNAIRG